MEERLDELLCHLRPIQDLHAAAEILEWDQETYMPVGAADARARQVATLCKVAHERFVADRVGDLLEALSADTRSLDPLSFAASLVRVTHQDYVRARKLPAALVAEIAEASGHAKIAWRVAREADDYNVFAPHLERIIALATQKAEAVGYEDSIYDALLDEFEPGMKTATVAEIFDALRKELVPLVHAIARCEAPDDTFLHQPYDTDAQWNFGMDILKDIGYDFTRGRQDISTHPFSTSFSINDVRITTRIHEAYVPSGLFSTLHEAGHALYEQGIDLALEGTPLADGTSLGMHESQSRLWENQVGRSWEFWECYYQKLQAAFPVQLGAVPLEKFYRGINKVSPSFIRVESDEVTYNLHIMLRFELEQALVEGRLAVVDVPEVWNTMMEEYLGRRPVSHAEGVLQDIHWSLGAIGYFPTYTLGNLMSAQLFECAQKALPDLESQIAGGKFSDLLEWLHTHVHVHGRKLSAQNILQRITGEGLRADPWLTYVRQKCGEIYGGL